jgi:CheY-like chemotaxis protein
VQDAKCGNKLLVVDDDLLLRMSLSKLFTILGYSVRSAADGFSALSEIRKEIPDIILSDLNMPGMSGFELLSVARHRFPAIHLIAMSAAFSGNGVPPEVTAAAFYEKGTNLDSLLQIVEDMALLPRPSVPHPTKLKPMWNPRTGDDPSAEAYAMIVCPECLRMFPQSLADGNHPSHEIDCVYCHSPIHYVIPQSAESVLPQVLPRKPCVGCQRF